MIISGYELALLVGYISERSCMCLGLCKLEFGLNGLKESRLYLGVARYITDGLSLPLGSAELQHHTLHCSECLVLSLEPCSSEAQERARPTHITAHPPPLTAHTSIERERGRRKGGRGSNKGREEKRPRGEGGGEEEMQKSAA